MGQAKSQQNVQEGSWKFQTIQKASQKAHKLSTKESTWASKIKIISMNKFK